MARPPTHHPPLTTHHSLLTTHSSTPLLLHDLAELVAGVAVGGVVRAGVDAARLAVQLRAEVAHGRLLLDHRHLAAGLVRVVLHHLEAVHVDVTIRAVIGAVAAADAPGLDDHLARFLAMDGIDRTARHAVRVQTRTTGRGHQPVLEAQAVADQPRHAEVRVGTRLGALVAAGALGQVED